MNFDDSQLSAFLDEELDPGDRQLVAWSLESSSVMAQQLADFRSIQGEIAGLERPAIPVDLTANFGVRMDTSAGGFVFALSNVLSFIPVRGEGPAGE